MRFNGVLLVGIALGALAACEAPKPAPMNPTYVDDVEPILRGNCFHCHGPVRPSAVSFRWDFFDPADPRLKAIGDFSSEFPMGGASNAAHGFAQIVPLVSATSEARMPPPPASPLSAEDITTLQRFYPNATAKPPRGTRNPNQPPTAAWLNKPSTVVVSDGDREQVLGKIVCGSKETAVLYSGTTKLADGSQPPCTASLYDGQDPVTVPLN
jgi:hypothetical protein